MTPIRAMRRRGRPRRAGMVLLTVLLLVALMAAMAAAILDDVRFSVRRAVNVERQAQAQWYAEAGQRLALERLGRLASEQPMELLNRPLVLPIEGGAMAVTVQDGQSCFNLNSLVRWTGDRRAVNPAGPDQLIALGRALGVSPVRMTALIDGAIDWIDTDSDPRATGAEDSAYVVRAQPYRTSGAPMAEVSELRAVRGVDAPLYRRLRPYLCALPTEGTRINVNTLTAEDAPLVVMLAGGRLSLAEARAVIAARPPGGWTDADAFWRQGAMAALRPEAAVRDQVVVTTEYFRLRINVDFAEAKAVRTLLVRARGDGPARAAIVRWTLEE